MTGVNHVPGGIVRRVPGTCSNVSITITGNSALAKPRGGIAKDIVDGALDVAVGVILLAALRIKGILIAIKATCIVSLLVSICGHSHCLGTFSIKVLEVDIIGLEVGTDNVKSRRGIEAAGCSRVDIASESHHIGLLGANTVNIFSTGTLLDQLYTVEMWCTHFEV